MSASESLRNDQFHMHLYHGTSASHVSDIMEKGLGHYGDTPGSYLTHDYDLALDYANDYEDPTVLTVRANPRNLRVDWNSFDEPVHGYAEDENRRTFNPSKLRNRETDWKNSLRETGAVFHKGVIKPRNIIDVETL